MIWLPAQMICLHRGRRGHRRGREPVDVARERARERAARAWSRRWRSRRRGCRRRWRSSVPAVTGGAGADVGDDCAGRGLFVDRAAVGDVRGRARGDRREVQRLRRGRRRWRDRRRGSALSWGERAPAAAPPATRRAGRSGQSAWPRSRQSSSLSKQHAEGSHPQNNDLFRRPAGLADGLALKEPALLTVHRGIRPKQLGSPVP